MSNNTIEIEYEVASECKIYSEEEYNAGNFLIGFKRLVVFAGLNGLYYYSIRMKKGKIIEGEEGKRNPLADIDTLLALLALYFGCRFFKIAQYDLVTINKTFYPF